MFGNGVGEVGFRYYMKSANGWRVGYACGSAAVPIPADLDSTVLVVEAATAHTWWPLTCWVVPTTGTITAAIHSN